MSRSIKEAWQQAMQKLLQTESESAEKRLSRRLEPTMDRSKDTVRPALRDAETSVSKPVVDDPGRSVLAISGDARCRVESAPGRTLLLSDSFEEVGRNLQVRSDGHRDERDLTLGLDFGTSCTKVIIGDRAAGHSFAVPFQGGTGIDTYLLASRVFETAGNYSLIEGERVHRDLKLSLFGGGDGDDADRRVVAYLSLVIRRARGWLLKHHQDIYRDTKIHWTLSLGLPARQNFDRRLSERFKRIALAAWFIAGAHGKVSRQAIDREMVRIVREGAESTEVEVKVIPEIAAQIYGFVVSDSFDPKGRNIFLIADVGSGTVDSSLFYVKRVKGSKYNFSFYTSTVELYGVANLHRHRAEWWECELRKLEPESALLDELTKTLGTTDHDLRVPESYLEYFSGVQVDLESGSSPDDKFFSKVSGQVAGSTFRKAVTDRQAPMIQLRQVPFYLCGGGSRMQYYRRLEKHLAAPSGSIDISARATPLTVPRNLTMESVLDRDYDRLSVAYGLAWLEPGWVVETEPMRPLDQDPERPTWRDNFVGKDQM